jgi:hypothetical protein
MGPRCVFRGAVLCASVACLSSVVALAQESEQPAEEASIDATIASIREMVLYARYADAEQAVEALVARSDLSPSHRNQALEIKAIILLARRQTRRADEVLRELYGRDPEHRIVDRDVGPSVHAAFERIRDSRPPAATVTLQNSTPASLESRTSPAITVRMAEGANVVSELRISYRNADSVPFERVIMRLDDAHTEGRTRLPLREGTEAYALHYFVEALAPSQAVVGSLGSEAEPIVLEVPEQAVVEGPNILGGTGGGGGTAPGGGNVLEEWWFWTIVGVLVVGGAVTIGALYGTHVIGPPGNGTLGGGML